MTSAEASVPFDYSAVERALGELDDLGESSAFIRGLQRILDWVDRGPSELAKAIRLKAVRYYFTGQPLRQLARQAGVTKQAICKAANQFRDEFGIESPHQRSDDTRAQFSIQCQERHQRRLNSPA